MSALLRLINLTAQNIRLKSTDGKEFVKVSGVVPFVQSVLSENRTLHRSRMASKTSRRVLPQWAMP